MPALVCCLLHTYSCATWILADICCLSPPPADYYWQNGPCLLLAAYCPSSVCHLLMNAGWYLLSVIATCWLLLTEWHISTHVCCLLHAANLLPVTWCLMMSDICCLILPPASCLPTNWCPFWSVVCCTDTPVLLFVIWWLLAYIYYLLLPPAVYRLRMTAVPLFAWSQLLLLVDTNCLLIPHTPSLPLTAACRLIPSNIYCLVSDASCMLFLLLVSMLNVANCLKLLY